MSQTVKNTRSNRPGEDLLRRFSRRRGDIGAGGTVGPRLPANHDELPRSQEAHAAPERRGGTLERHRLPPKAVPAPCPERLKPGGSVVEQKPPGAGSVPTGVALSGRLLSLGRSDPVRQGTWWDGLARAVAPGCRSRVIRSSTWSMMVKPMLNESCQWPQASKQLPPDEAAAWEI